MRPTEKTSGELAGPTSEQLAADRSGDATLEWLCRQPSAFFRPYAGQWIAARDCTIVTVAANHRELMAQLKGVDLRSTIIHRVERPGKVIYR